MTLLNPDAPFPMSYLCTTFMCDKKTTSASYEYLLQNKLSLSSLKDVSYLRLKVLHLEISLCIICRLFSCFNFIITKKEENEYFKT